MKRALTMLFVVPGMSGLLFGILAVAAIPMLLLAALVLGLPMFLLCARLRWLAWWHAALGGTLAGAIVAGLYWSGGGSGHWHFAGPPNAVLLIVFGTVLGVAVWFCGIFRNPAFPFVVSGFPWPALLLVPLVGGGLLLSQRMQPLPALEGRVVALGARAAGTEMLAVRVRLRGGQVVPAAVFWQAGERSPLGQCYTVNHRWSPFAWGEVYSASAPKLGEAYDDC